MNLSAWIDLQGLFVELPLITPLTPEGWTLPSSISLCICAANIGPILIVLLRWRQGKRFSEIPYIYIIIIIGIVSCCVMAVSWQKTVLLFGRERSVWLLGTILTLSLLDCTSSLVFFDYMKRFRAHYLTAAFLGEGLTTLLPTLLALLQGIGSDTICVSIGNGTILEPIYSQPRFSVTVFLFLIAGIILLSLTAFILLRWTNIVSLADAAELVNKQSLYYTCNLFEKINFRIHFRIPGHQFKSNSMKLLRWFLISDHLTYSVLHKCLLTRLSFSYFLMVSLQLCSYGCISSLKFLFFTVLQSEKHIITQLLSLNSPIQLHVCSVFVGQE